MIRGKASCSIQTAGQAIGDFGADIDHLGTDAVTDYGNNDTADSVTHNTSSRLFQSMSHPRVFALALGLVHSTVGLGDQIID